MIFNLILSAVLALVVAQIDVLTTAGVVNIDLLAAVDIEPDVLNDADKLGLGSLLPGPVLHSTTLIPLNFLHYSTFYCKCFSETYAYNLNH